MPCAQEYKSQPTAPATTFYNSPPPYLTATYGDQVDIKDLERSFMFNTGFQSSSAIAKNMEYAVGSLSVNRDFLEELRQEVDGKVRIVTAYPPELHVSAHAREWFRGLLAACLLCMRVCVFGRSIATAWTSYVVNFVVAAKIVAAVAAAAASIWLLFHRLGGCHGISSQW